METNVGGVFMENKLLSISGGSKSFIAHRREKDGAEQSLRTHPEETSSFYGN